MNHRPSPSTVTAVAALAALLTALRRRPTVRAMTDRQLAGLIRRISDEATRRGYGKG